ncbi:MAG: DUF1828 domain-containing protein [Planctomycetota bacterium]
MDQKLLLDAFRKKVCEHIEIESEGVNRYAVYTPFMFDDGDHFVTLLQKEKDDSGWVITDDGHTLMHLGYSGVDMSSGTRARIVEESLAAHSVENRAGELRIAVPGEEFGDALYSYLQALSRIATVPQMTQERVASTFREDFSTFLSSIIPAERIAFDWHDVHHDPDANCTVDCRINGGPKPCFVFAVNSTDKCSHATITCLMFERWMEAFRSVVLFEDQTTIGRRQLAQLTNVVGRQFPSLGERDRIQAYFDEEVLAHP